MPVIVVGADTPAGDEVVAALLPREGEVRVFVSDEAAARRFRSRGAKVATGDVSDGSHIGGAAMNAFSAVLLADAATDDRERSFADDQPAVFDAWAEGLSDAGVRRVIFVAGTPTEPTPALRAAAPEFIAVEATRDVASRVAALDEAERL